jgi:hypothetical protein
MGWFFQKKLAIEVFVLFFQYLPSAEGAAKKIRNFEKKIRSFLIEHF